MQTFKPGDKVRERGKKTVMTVKGNAGLASNSVTRTTVAMVGRLVCEWTNARGRLVSRSFTTLSLEPAEE